MKREHYKKKILPSHLPALIISLWFQWRMWCVCHWKIVGIATLMKYRWFSYRKGKRWLGCHTLQHFPDLYLIVFLNYSLSSKVEDNLHSRAKCPSVSTFSKTLVIFIPDVNQLLQGLSDYQIPFERQLCNTSGAMIFYRKLNKNHIIYLLESVCGKNPTSRSPPLCWDWPRLV